MSPNRDLRYCVKIINPESKGGYLVEEFMDKKFINVHSLRSKMTEIFEKYIIQAEF